MNFYVYVYFDPTRDLEAFYVGKGKGSRSHNHLTRTDHHPFTYRLQKMARQGVIPIIERYEGLTEEAALSLEVALISEIGRKDLGTGTLLNLTDGGEGTAGRVFTEEQKSKISSAKKGRKFSDEHKEKISASQKGKTREGRPHTDEAKAKMSASKKGKKMSDKYKASVSASLTGRKWTDERKAKFSLILKAKGKKGIPNA